ncbi:hypothetical protein ACFY19_20735 [Streptosporangium saharense]|uniref:hypothetical protein n=1 Tax=Streptosporangium saharense TaxID=1706840 RepID=UPI0036C972B0
MRFYKITAPDKGYNGSVGGVGFHKGVARVAEDEAGSTLAYFARKGYTVEVVEETPAVPAETGETGGGEQTETGGDDKTPPTKTSRPARN